MKLTRVPSRLPQQGKTGEEWSVLYVEDEDTNWEVTELALRERYRLTRARTADEVFYWLRWKKFQVILMDIQLSGSALDGIEITQILKGRATGVIPDFARGVGPIETPIVFVTAYSARYRRGELLAAGGDDVILKPVDFIRLSLVVSRLIVRGLGPVQE